MSDLEHDAFTDDVTPAEKTLLAIKEALDAAGAPRTDTERDGVGINLELDYAARIRWLVEQRNDVDSLFREVTKALDDTHTQHTHVVDRIRWLAADRDAKEAALEDARRHRAAFMTQRDEALHSLSVSESNLSVLHTCIRQAIGAISAVNGVEVQPDVTPLQMLEQLRDIAYDTEGWRKQCGTNERTIARLTSKIKRLEASAKTFELKQRERLTSGAKKTACAKPKARRRT